ncbi:molybdate ABC transporter substrate-binding protein [Streptomyces alkaliterrae]|uniref:Molybdate ABC transporter substrate-binding protein n=2 Tax=Streptomyces alkaliterrae TaxID=2213162 RepID=A0A5P0YYM2_9ACTN|nr:molybdate ABC transporter substrate-binding protein [Streptomyces alkaliterrae]
MPHVSPPRRRLLGAALALLLTAPLAACGGGGGRADGADTRLTVLAAASLTDVLRAAGAAYEKEHDDTRVRFSFAGSQELVAQVKQGAPADVLVTADTDSMDTLADRTDDPTVVARNRLVIAVAKGNPERLDGLADLGRTGLKVVLAAPEVPAGRYARDVLDRQKVKVGSVSDEPSVRAALSKIELGEADAGIVYATDAASSDRVDTVAVPDRQNIDVSYPAAVLTDAPNRESAADFVDWLNSPAARRVFADAGFQQP